MARITKLDLSKRIQFERKEKKREPGNRILREYFLIVCEGERTEPNYFDSIKKSLPVGLVDVEIKGVGMNTRSLVGETIRLRAVREKENNREYDQVWAVFDKDSFDKDFNSAIQMGAQNKIDCAWSNEAFEIWYLLHFAYFTSGHSRDEYKELIEKHVKKVSKNPNLHMRKTIPTCTRSCASIATRTRR